MYFCRRNKKNIDMANVITTPAQGQILVNIEDISLMKDIKRAISLLKGVASVKVQKTAVPKTLDITQTAGFREAMEDIKHGRVYHAEGVEEMFKQILG